MLDRLSYNGPYGLDGKTITKILDLDLKEFILDLINTKNFIKKDQRIIIFVEFDRV